MYTGPDGPPLRAAFAWPTSIDGPLNGPDTVALGWTTVNVPPAATFWVPELSLQVFAGKLTCTGPNGKSPCR